MLLDDVKVASATFEQHFHTLKEIFKRFNDNNVKLNSDKCEFFKDSINYCGHIIDKNGVHKDKKKTEAMKKMPAPRDVSEVRRFIGFVTYYSRFIKNLSSILKPLNDLLQKENKFEWTKECQKAFETAKAAFTSDDFVVHYDHKLPLLLACDASPYGIGAVLSHRFPDGSDKPIIYISHSLNKVQRNYSQIDKKAFAIVYSIKRLYQYLYGIKFAIASSSFKYLAKIKIYPFTVLCACNTTQFFYKALISTLNTEDPNTTVMRIVYLVYHLIHFYIKYNTTSLIHFTLIP